MTLQLKDDSIFINDVNVLKKNDDEHKDLQQYIESLHNKIEHIQFGMHDEFGFLVCDHGWCPENTWTGPIRKCDNRCIKAIESENKYSVRVRPSRCEKCKLRKFGNQRLIGDD